MNLTLSVDEKAVERAREVARQQGTSLNALIRQYIENLGGKWSGEQILRELQRLWAESAGNSGGEPIRRSDAYEGRLP
jgi:hypothetical protein